MSTDLIRHYAEAIVVAVDGDIALGFLPASVRTFSDLHDYLDADGYLDDADVPFDGTRATADVIAAVQDEVTRRLSDARRPFCTYGACGFGLHDHSTARGADGRRLPSVVPMRCDSCGHPSHFDAKLGVFRHDDPTTGDCPLIHRDTRGAGPVMVAVTPHPQRPMYPSTVYPFAVTYHDAPLPHDLDAARAEIARRTDAPGGSHVPAHTFAAYQWAMTTCDIVDPAARLAALSGERVLVGHHAATTVTLFSARVGVLLQVPVAAVTGDRQAATDAAASIRAVDRSDTE